MEPADGGADGVCRWSLVLMEDDSAFQLAFVRQQLKAVVVDEEDD